MLYNEEKEERGSNGDFIILFAVIWMFLNRLFWITTSKFGSDFYSSLWFRPLSVIINIVWALIPIALAFAVKDRTKRTILIVIGGLYVLFDLYNYVVQYMF